MSEEIRRLRYDLARKTRQLEKVMVSRAAIHSQLYQVTKELEALKKKHGER